MLIETYDRPSALLLSPCGRGAGGAPGDSKHAGHVEARAPSCAAHARLLPETGRSLPGHLPERRGTAQLGREDVAGPWMQRAREETEMPSSSWGDLTPPPVSTFLRHDSHHVRRFDAQLPGPRSLLCALGCAARASPPAFCELGLTTGTARTARGATKGNEVPCLSLCVGRAGFIRKRHYI